VPFFTSLIINLTASLQKQYIKHVKALQQMGGGTGQDSSNKGSADEGTDVVMDLYIPPDGPDNITIPEARNKILCSLFCDISYICI